MRKFIGIGVLLALIVAGIWAANKYQAVYSPNVAEELQSELLQIPSNTTFSGLLQLFQEQGIVKDTASFSWLAGKMNYKKPIVRAGQFTLTPGSSNLDLIRLLRNGKQTPVKLIINNERFVSDIMGKVSKQLEPDSLSFLAMAYDLNFIAELDDYTSETLISLFIPNTYELYWNTTPEDFFKRMKKESDKFWDKDDRRKKAADLGLNEKEVYTLASIIRRETNAKSELPIIAGLYLNRLEQGMLLQADPTVVFANGEFDLRRVLNKHLAFDSPYNTYLYQGLPPGPISMATINSLDGVLNRTDHDYIFFCAKPDNSGLHAFAKSLSAHNANARKFHSWLNKRGIR